MNLIKKCECTNEKITSKILHILNTTHSRDETSIARITYTISFLLTELEKFLFLIMLFALFHKLTEFFIMFFTLIPFRVFMGGLHRKTIFGCVSHTILMFSAILLAASYINVNIIGETILFTLAIILIWLTTPIYSEKRIKYSLLQKKNFKLKALTVLVIFSQLLRRVSAYVRNIMMCTIILQLLEVGLVYLIKKEGSETE